MVCDEEQLQGNSMVARVANESAVRAGQLQH
jgi:hypothetical protein